MVDISFFYSNSRLVVNVRKTQEMEEG